MQIIIVGCGKVGRGLVTQLSAEGHSVTAIDINRTVLSKVSEVNDIIGIEGNATSIQTLTEAGVKDADLLIAVTQSDEVNILCCVMAKSGNKCRTIARVRDPIYLTEQQFFTKELGISMVVNPERSVAREMAALLRLPSAVEIDTFNKGRLEMLTFRVPDDSFMIGKRLMDLSSLLKGEVLLCVAERNNRIIIPDGSFVAEKGDLLSFVAGAEAARDFFKRNGFSGAAARTVMIVGGGEVGYYLAERLIKSGIRVKIIDRDRQRCDELADRLPEAAVICGDGTDITLLREENIETHDAFVAATNLDEENIILSLYARDKVKSKVITKVSHSALYEVIGGLRLDSIVNPMEISAETIVKYARAMNNSMGSDIEALYMLRGGRVEAMEFVVKKQFSGIGIPLQQLNLKHDLLIAGITRNGVYSIPRGSDSIHEGDSVIIVTANKGFQTLDDILER